MPPLDPNLSLALPVMAALAALFLGWAMGAHTAVNTMAPAVGARALGLRHAVLIAVLCAIAGAWLAGGAVTDTYHSRLVAIEGDAGLRSVCAALLASGLWVSAALALGWPVSITHTSVSALIGVTLFEAGAGAINWSTLGGIVFGWATAPLVAAALAYLFTSLLQRQVYHRHEPEAAAKRAAPMIAWLATTSCALAVTLSGAPYLGLSFRAAEAVLIAGACGLAPAGLVALFNHNLRSVSDAELREFHFAGTERQFNAALVVCAAALSFAHGANDTGNALGPALLALRASLDSTASLPMTSGALLLGGGIAVALGIATLGARVLSRISRNISELRVLTSSKACALCLAAILPIQLCSIVGLPVSVLHTLVGGVLGVALARSLSALDLRAVRAIFLSWVFTVPAVVLLAGALAAALRLML